MKPALVWVDVLDYPREFSCLSAAHSYKNNASYQAALDPDLRGV